MSQTESESLTRHPAGLRRLFITEMFERFSFYGMRAILLYFMIAKVGAGGLGFSDQEAQSVLGTYVMCVYLACIPGGIIADKWLGARHAVRWGGVLIALGHFTMAAHSLAAFYIGLALIVAGTGFLKPNISNMLGGLYQGRTDQMRDNGFSIFYLGINIGAFVAPIVCGFLAQNAWFKTVLESWGLDPRSSWHWGFAAAGVGMILGLIQYELGQKTFGNVGLKQTDARQGLSKAPLTADDWRRMGALAVLFVFAVLFFAIYEQGSNSLALFAERKTDNHVPLLGWGFESSMFQSINPLFITIVTPVFTRLWRKLQEAKREPSSPVKFAMGLFFMSLAIGVMVLAGLATRSGSVSPMWLTGFFFLECVGEMCLSPVGLSTVSKLSPPRFSGLMLGLWFLASALGGKLAGFLGGFYRDDYARMATLFGGMSLACLLAAVLLFKLSPKLEGLMGDSAAKEPVHG